MRHFTEDAINKDVIDRKGESLGKVTGIEDGNAVIKTETSLEDRMEQVFATRSDGDGLVVTPDMVEESTGDWIRVHVTE